MKTPLTLLLLLTLLGCREKDPFQEKLIGTWRLIEYCKPTGQTTCTKITVPSDKGVFVAFTTRNEVIEWYENQDKRPVEYAFLGVGGSYQIEGKNLRILTYASSSSQGRLVEVVSLTPQRMVLNPYGTGEYVFEKR